MSIYKKINQVMKAVHGVAKDSENKHGKYKYAGHEAVTAALRDEFVRAGIVRTVSVESIELVPGGTVKIMVRVRHFDVDDESFVESMMPAVQPTQTSGGTFTAQQVGQALSYAQKAVEFKLFALTGDPEPDSDSSEANAPHEGARPAPSEPARARAESMLREFDVAACQSDIDAVSAHLRAEWPALKAVPGLVEEITSRRNMATKRVKNAGGYDAPPRNMSIKYGKSAGESDDSQREPGQEG